MSKIELASSSYGEFCIDRAGRKARTAEAQRKQIDAMLDVLQTEQCYWFLESLRRLLIAITRFDDRAVHLADTLDCLDRATERETSILSAFARRLTRPRAGKA